MSLGPRSGEPLLAAVEADYHLCLSCNACRSSCAVNIASGRLAPLELLRFAALGMLDELLRAPALWYCLQCNQCSHTCPMTVAPSRLVRTLRREALVRGVIDRETLDRYEALKASFQRVRWHMIDQRARGAALAEAARDWQTWAASPIASSHAPLRIDAASTDGAACRRALSDFLGFAPDLAACMTCGACATSCPGAHDRAVFDPVSIFRMANLGAHEELLVSPALWMCLGCQSCAEACTQRVAGHLVIKGLQELSLARGLAPAAMRQIIREIDRALVAEFLTEVDALMAPPKRS